MNEEFKIAAPCGLICDNCSFYQGNEEIKCPGCLESKGKPFWGECEVFTCNLMQKTEHCGECKEFPCDTIINQYDPNHPKGKQEAIFRIGQLTIRTKIGTKKWLNYCCKGTLPMFDKE